MQISISNMATEFVGCTREFPKARCRVRLKAWKWRAIDDRSSQGHKAYNDWLQQIMTRPMPPSPTIPWPQFWPPQPSVSYTRG